MNISNPVRKGIIAALIVTAAVFLGFSVKQGIIGLRNHQEKDTKQTNPDYTVRSVKLPENVIFAGEKMPLDNFDTRESLERELLISAYRHSATILIIKRANRYLPLIEKILKQYNIPDDFKYLAAAESDFTNMVSPAGATGFWQIMAETGREEGMEINQVVDERYSVEKSTEFACNYFLKSFERYGNWTLAAASYNGGRARIDEQIEIQHQKNYYDLLLAEETARYIFRAVAYKLIITDPAAYGFDIGKDDLYPELKYNLVSIDTTISDMSHFAEKFGTNYKMLKFFNPWLRKPYLPQNPKKIYVIKIPAEGMRSNDKSTYENGSYDKEGMK